VAARLWLVLMRLWLLLMWPSARACLLVRVWANGLLDGVA
jgi:hypothetical protein